MSDIKVKSVYNGYEVIAKTESFSPNLVVIATGGNYEESLQEALYTLDSLAEQVRHRLETYRVRA